MRSRVIVMEVVYSISPLRRPAIACKQLFEARRRVRTPRVLDTAIEQYGKMFVVQHPAIAGETQNLRISGCSASTCTIGSVPHSGGRPETQSPEHTHESSSVHHAILSGGALRQAGCVKEPGLFSAACHFGVRSLLAWASARRTPSASKSAV